MNSLKLVLKDTALHLYAWLAVIPRTFLIMVFIIYFWDGEINSFSDAFEVVLGNRVLVVFLLLWGIINGYVEGWLILKYVRKRKRDGQAGKVAPLR